jgi:hypothetical protein
MWNADLSNVVREVIRYSLHDTLEQYVESAETSRVFAIGQLLQRHIGVTEALAGVRRKRVIRGLIYKEPFLSFSPELPYEALRDCRMVHIYRDGRDAADSLVRSYEVLTDAKLKTAKSNEVTWGRQVGDRVVPWWVDDGREQEFLDASPYIRAIWMWSVMVRRSHNFATRSDVAASGRVLEVCYESLMIDPETEGKRVLEHFGLRLNRRIRQKLASAHGRSVGIHRRREADEVVRATELAASELRLLGYIDPPGSPEIGALPNVAAPAPINRCEPENL